MNAAALASAIGCLMLAGALAFQHWGDLAPCALCIDQRKAWGAVIAFGTLAVLADGYSRIAVALALLAFAAIAALAGAGIAGFHVGVEQSWWNGTAACGGGMGDIGTTSISDLRDRLLAQPVVRCDEIAWSMLGVSMAGWNGLISLATGVGALYVVVRDIGRERKA